MPRPAQLVSLLGSCFVSRDLSLKSAIGFRRSPNGRCVGAVSRLKTGSKVKSRTSLGSKVRGGRKAGIWRCEREPCTMRAIPSAGQEALVVAMVVVKVVASLLDTASGSLRNEAKGLVILTAGSMFVEFASREGRKLWKLNPRPTQSPGILLGSLTLPIVMAARLLQIVRVPLSSPFVLENARVVFWGSFACSSGLLLFLGNLVLWPGDGREARETGKQKDIDKTRWKNSWSGFECLGFVVGIAGLAMAQGSQLGLKTGAGLVIWGLVHAVGCRALFQYLLHSFPACVSAGEAMLVAQGLALYAGNAAVRTLAKIIFLDFLPEFLLGGVGDAIDAILQALILGLLFVPFLYNSLLHSLALKPLLYVHKDKVAVEGLSKAVLFYVAVVLVVFCAMPAWLQSAREFTGHPIIWALHFVLEEPTQRLGLCVYWVVAICLLILGLYRLAMDKQVARILVRKGFHLMVVIMFVPALLFQPDFLRLAFALAMAAFLVVEMVRIWRVPPFGETVHHFLKAFTDGRDSDILIISHFSLLLGCALPVWLSAMSPMDRPLAPYAGILSLGIGDTMASVIGYNFGSRRFEQYQQEDS